MKKDYGEIIVTAMRRRGVTQHELADVLGLNHTTISRKLQPNANWWIHHYIKAIEYLGIDPDEVFGEGRVVGSPQADGGLMAKVYSLVQGFKSFQRNPQRFLNSLQQLCEVEHHAPDDFEKLLHDIEYLHSRVERSKKTAEKKNV